MNNERNRFDLNLAESIGRAQQGGSLEQLKLSLSPGSRVHRVAEYGELWKLEADEACHLHAQIGCIGSEHQKCAREHESAPYHWITSSVL